MDDFYAHANRGYQKNPSQMKKLTFFCLLLASVTSLMGLGVLIAWILDIHIVANVLPNHITMKPNTAIGMLICGLSVIIISLKLNSKLMHYGVIIASSCIMLIALMTLVEYLLQINLGIEKVPFNDLENAINTARMSPTTAFCFLNISIAIVLTSQSNVLYLRKPLVLALSFAVLLISGLVLLSYIPNILLATHFLSYANMGIHTSLLFVFLSIALIILIRSEGEFNWALNRYATLGCIFCLFTLMAISSAFYGFIYSLKNTDEEIIQTKLLNQEIQNVLTTLTDKQENSFNNQVYSKNLIEHKNKLNQSLSTAETLIAGNSKQQLLLNQLKNEMNKEIIAAETTKSHPLQTSSVNRQELFSLLRQLGNGDNQLSLEHVIKQKSYFNQALYLSPLGTYLSITMLLIGIFILNTTIGERKKMIASQKKLAEIVESSNDGIIGKNLNGIVTSWNIGSEQIFGYTAKEMIGQSILKLIPEDRIEEEANIINRIKKGDKIEHFETVRQRKDGKPINVSVTVSPIKNEANEIIGASKIVRDFTEQKQLELQLKQSQKMSAIGQLAGGIAHDFNNLLGIMLGNLDMLVRNLAGNESALKKVNVALKAATRGADLTKRLLVFSRRQQLNPIPTKIDESVNDIVEMASRIVGHNINIITQMDNSIPPVLIDPTELESALLNLVVNARDAMPDGGEITISTKLLELDSHHIAVQSDEMKPGKYACASVSDTGEGISPEILTHVFEPFFTTKEQGKGTGMGLAMVYGFAKQSGGIVRIYSEVGHGTTVSLYLPFAKDTEQPVHDKQLREKIPLNGKALLVDDELDLLEIASAYLKEMGFDVLHAINAKSALNILEQNPDIKLLVTDVVMPGGINGFELAEKIRQIKPEIVTVYSSGFPATTLTTNENRDFNSLLISKPYNRESFVKIIYQAFNHKSDSATLSEDSNHG